MPSLRVAIRDLLFAIITLCSPVLASSVSPTTSLANKPNTTYYNPVLPGWHSDPSCAVVEDTFFCVTSTFIAFPGLPVYASDDLLNWRLVSHTWNRESQLPPGTSWNTTGQVDGMYAATLRYRDGVFYVICEYLGLEAGLLGVIFTTTDPFDPDGWSDAVIFHPEEIDPDLFWDDEGSGKVYVATASIVLQELDLETGELYPETPVSIWNGTGGVWSEGPHIYRKDGWYYLLIAEGGTELGHTVAIARSKDIWGPYEAHPHNPIMTNRDTDEYFQTVGHADLFQDAEGFWWGMCLSTRSGPEWTTYPMGRESVLFPVTWNEGEWPILEPIRGEMSGWPSMPPPKQDRTRKLHQYPLNTDPDVFDFPPSSEIPKNLMYWRVPRVGAITIGDQKQGGGLLIEPSRNNLTGTLAAAEEEIELTGQRGLAFVGRLQAHTLFQFSVDLTLPAVMEAGQEAGVTVFLTQLDHLDLGIVALEPNSTKLSGGKPRLALRFRAEGVNATESVVIPVPGEWANALSRKARLEIRTPNSTHYEFWASLTGSKEVLVATAPARIVSGGSGPFVGSLVGVYATCNGAGSGVDCPSPSGGGNVARFERWRYTGVGQYIDHDKVIFQ